MAKLYRIVDVESKTTVYFGPLHPNAIIDSMNELREGVEPESIKSKFNWQDAVHITTSILVGIFALTYIVATALAWINS